MFYSPSNFSGKVTNIWKDFDGVVKIGGVTKQNSHRYGVDIKIAGQNVPPNFIKVIHEWPSEAYCVFRVPVIWETEIAFMHHIK